MALSKRLRFEVFKRDGFTCQYCGKKSPEVILEVDHIRPVCEGGADDLINLTTSCFDCNRGKGPRQLNELVTGEDPHDRAIELLERRRQLDEYNYVLGLENQRVEDEAWELIAYWKSEQGYTTGLDDCSQDTYRSMKSFLRRCPKEQIKVFMDSALLRGITNLRYIGGCIRMWAQENPPEPPR
jgi:hypothetical protein